MYESLYEGYYHHNKGLKMHFEGILRVVGLPTKLIFTGIVHDCICLHGTVFSEKTGNRYKIKNGNISEMYIRAYDMYIIDIVHNYNQKELLRIIDVEADPKKYIDMFQSCKIIYSRHVYKKNKNVFTPAR